MRTLERPPVALLLWPWVLTSCAFLVPQRTLDEGTIDRATSAALAAQHAVAVSDAILGLDGMLDPARGLDALTSAIAARAAGACEAAHEIDGAIVVPDVPCALSGGRTALVTLAARTMVDRDDDGADVVRVELDVSASLGGQWIEGHVTVRSRDGLEHRVVIDLTIRGHQVVADVSVRAVDGTFVLDGSARSDSLTMILDALAWTPGDCYPSAGRIAGGNAAHFQTITLDARTASSGSIEVQQRNVPTDTAFMPVYGDCGGGW